MHENSKAGPEQLEKLKEARDKAWEYFEQNPGSYGAMADWEMRDELYQEALRSSLQIAPEFHKHLDECQQCRDHPFALCPVGAKLLTEMR